MSRPPHCSNLERTEKRKCRKERPRGKEKGREEGEGRGGKEWRERGVREKEEGQGKREREEEVERKGEESDKGKRKVEGKGKVGRDIIEEDSISRDMMRAYLSHDSQPLGRSVLGRSMLYSRVLIHREHVRGD